MAPGRRSFLTGSHLFSVPAEAPFVQVFLPADCLLDAPVLHQTLAASILMSLGWLLIWSHGYSSFSCPCPFTHPPGLPRHETGRTQRANKATSGLLSSFFSGRGAGSCSLLFSLLSPSFPHSLTWEQLSSVNSKQVHVPKHFQMPEQVMLWNVF